MGGPECSFSGVHPLTPTGDQTLRDPHENICRDFHPTFCRWGKQCIEIAWRCLVELTLRT